MVDGEGGSSERCLKWGGGSLRDLFKNILKQGVGKGNSCSKGARGFRRGHHPCPPENFNHTSRHLAVDRIINCTAHSFNIAVRPLSRFRLPRLGRSLAQTMGLYAGFHSACNFRNQTGQGCALCIAKGILCFTSVNK